MSATAAAPSSATAIRPFTPEILTDELAALRYRIRATRWPERELVPDQSQGVQLATIQALAEYWANEYDMGRLQARLNAVPQFMTTIDGTDIHFIHVRSQHDGALPLIITHGWPGSIVEMLNVVGPLSDPTKFGGGAADAFDLVIPSMPGYGFSGKPTSNGWDVPHIADAWIELMRRLGYTRYVAQGGDWGALITDVMGAKAPAELLGIHSNMPGAVPAEITKTLTTGGPDPTGLTADEQRAFNELKTFYAKGLGYANEMGLRPQTLYGLTDSPVALASWMIDHDAQSLDDIAAAFAGQPVGCLTRDEVLDNVTLAWVTNTGVSAARLYWQNKLGFFDFKGVTVPAAVTSFPHELYQAPRTWAEKAYPKLIYFNEVDRGNHFAAWQEPDLFTTEIRAAFSSLRDGSSR